MTEKLKVKHRARIRLTVVVLSALSLLALSLALSKPGATQGAGQGQHVELVVHSDLQGRESLQVTAKSDDANGDWVYVGHHDYDSQKMNPITNQMEWNGTTILNVSDPAKSSCQ